MAARPDVIMATGRSDYPNQVNNVLGFPFIFRGALDCRATTINDEMKLAASHALAELAKEDVPDSVLRAYGKDRMSFGREYLIPKPFDYRVLLNVPVAVARAAAETGVAQEPIEDYDAYRRRLENMLGRSRGLMHEHLRARAAESEAHRLPRRRAGEDHPRGEDPHRREARPSDPARPPRGDRARCCSKYNVDESKITHHRHQRLARQYDRYAQRFHELRRRHGITIADAQRILNSRNYFAMMMLDAGDADGVIAGLRAYYPATHPARAADRQDAPRREARLRRLPADVQEPHADPRRHDREHRSRQRDAGRDRGADRGDGASASTSSRASP